MIFFIRLLDVFACLISNDLFEKIIELIWWKSKSVCFANVNYYQNSVLCAQWDFNINFINFSLDAIFIRWNLKTFILHLSLFSYFFSLFIRKIYLKIKEISSLVCVYIFTFKCEIDIDKERDNPSLLRCFEETWKINFLSI